MQKFIYLIFIISFIVFSSCEEEIEWKEEVLPEMLVVEGSFTNEYIRHNVVLTKSAPYFSNVPTPVVSGAHVTITDSENTIELIENPAGSGEYETVEPVAGIPGRTYTLNIDLAGPINGTSHYYAQGTLNMGIDLDSINVILYENPFYIPDFEIDSLITIMVIYGLDPLEINNFYEFKIYKNDTLLNDTIDESYIIEDVEGMEGLYAHTIPFFYQFDKNELIGLEIISVEKEYAEFVNGIMNIVNQSSGPFDMSGPPANTNTNIQGAEAMGFFKVAYTSKASALSRFEGLP